MNYLGEAGLARLIEAIRGEQKRMQDRLKSIETRIPASATWEGIRNLVRQGRASQYYAVGNRFVTAHDDYGAIEWEVVGLDVDTPAEEGLEHSMTLQARTLLPPMIFSEPQATYYAKERLTAGNYWFSLTSVDPQWGGGANLSLTLTRDLPAGGVLIFRWEEGTWSYDGTFETYASRNSRILLETGTVTSGAVGAQLSPVNDARRVRHGTNCWRDSTLRCYLNSDAAAGAVFSPVSPFDRTPDWDGTNGFLYGLEPEFRAVLGKVAVSEFDDETASTVTTEDLIFLPSFGQVYGGIGPAEGDSTPYPYYKFFTSTQRAGTDADESRIRTYDDTAASWWIRTPEGGCMSRAYCVTENGALSTAQADTKLCISPVCCIV